MTPRCSICLRRFDDKNGSEPLPEVGMPCRKLSQMETNSYNSDSKCLHKRCDNSSSHFINAVCKFLEKS